MEEGSPVERDLRDQLERAEAIAHMGSWEWDLASGTVTWTDELYRIYGLPPAQVITFELFLSCLLPEDRPRIQREIEAALQARGRFAYREHIRRPDGDERTLDTIGQVVTDAAGNAVSLIGSCRDITEEARRDARIQFYGDVFATVQIGLSVWQIDHRDGETRLRMVAFNPATEAFHGGPLAGKLGQTLVSVLPGLEGTELLAHARQIVEGAPARRFAPFRLAAAPGTPIVAGTLFALPGKHVGLALEDVTTARVAQIIQDGERRALEKLAKGESLREILETVIAAIEEASVGTLGSILLVDEDGMHVRHVAASSLPAEYARLIDGSTIGPAAGSCGTAVFRREPVFVTNIETDPLWEEYREVALRFGLRACWSSPIISSTGMVLGTFALYHRGACEADAVARELLDRATHVTKIVLERRALDEQMRALATRIEATREEERTSIARDLHDQLGQMLTALKFDLGWLDRRITDPTLAGRIAGMVAQTDELIGSVRRISSDLRPGILDDIGLAAAIEWQAEDFQIRTGTPCRVTAHIGDLQLDRELATTVFRVFQESLTNIARHANATGVEVTLELDRGSLKLQVADDGVGMPDVGPRGSTLGILGMGERARRLGGECTVRRRSPKGTIVTLTMPLRFPSERRDMLAP